MVYAGPLKRVFDLALSVPGLLVALPVIAIAMVAVRMTSPGRIVFAQERVGKGEAPFLCYKLRTMHEHTPDVPTHEVGADAVTSAGRVLRRFKIDELPQLWNVVKGEMSLVGPRPCLPRQAELIAHRRTEGVFALRPGITGLAQVRDIDMSRPQLCAQTDGEYMRRITLVRDIEILLRTVFRGRI